MADRTVIEGKWSGYSSSQSRVVYREATTDKALIEFCQNNYSISYTDGTCLILSCRPALPRERVAEMKSYRDLIRDCMYFGVDSVQALVDAKAAARPKAVKA